MLDKDDLENLGYHRIDEFQFFFCHCGFFDWVPDSIPTVWYLSIRGIKGNLELSNGVNLGDLWYNHNFLDLLIYLIVNWVKITLSIVLSLTWSLRSDFCKEVKELRVDVGRVFFVIFAVVIVILSVLRSIIFLRLFVWLFVRLFVIQNAIVAIITFFKIILAFIFELLKLRRISQISLVKQCSHVVIVDQPRRCRTVSGVNNGDLNFTLFNKLLLQSRPFANDSLKEIFIITQKGITIIIIICSDIDIEGLRQSR